MTLLASIRSRTARLWSDPSESSSRPSSPPASAPAASSRSTTPPISPPSTRAISTPRGSGRAVEVPPNARLLVVGASRSGKTSWVLAALARLLRFGELFVVVLDTKGERPLDDFARRHRFTIATSEAEGLRLVTSSKRPRRILVRCQDPLGPIANELLEAIYAGPPGTVVFDEAMHWSTKSQIPRGARLLLTAGGGRHIGVWACSQRPVEVSNFFLSESSHRVLFKIELADDQKKIAPLMALGPRANVSALEKYHWLWKGDDPYEPVRYFAPIELVG